MNDQDSAVHEVMHDTAATRYEHSEHRGLRGQRLSQTTLSTADEDFEMWAHQTEGRLKDLGVYAHRVRDLVVADDDGLIRLSFTVNGNGDPTSVQIILDCPFDELDAALSAALGDRRAEAENLS